LRTMLWTISLNAALLVSEAAADRDVVRRGDAIQRVTARMSRVVDDLIEVVRIEAGKLAVEPRVGDARRLAQDAVESFEPMAAARGVALATELRGDELQGRFDHERLLQVLGNLLNNAIRFSPDGGRVTLGVERTGPDLHLWVADAGPGIAADHLETIFDRFQQIERADHTGLGLGLYISRRIVAAHGGRIWAESQPGVGSTFHVVLPDAPPDGQSTVPRSA
ncbi:MAG TPA: HAMP domain-containing sensor histidine kinase, partial [Kofleriaceae bacterium]|nr:HAMP domain-containing sensor histidine kinase [Kofleriaceae bacterium]